MLTRARRSSVFVTLLSCATLVAACAPVDDLQDDVAIEESGLATAESSFGAADLAAACTVTISKAKELFVRDVRVVEDPVRTRWTGAVTNADDGAWHFGRLMANMAGTQDPAVFTRNWLRAWETTQTVNGFQVPARTAIRTIINAWPKRADGRLDLTRAPLRLLGIVNRIDLRNLAQGNAGEGRFVFGVLDGAGNQTQFTVILEYKLPAATQADVDRWAADWHALGSLTLGSATYNARLRAITNRFAGKNAAPGRVNGSSLGQIRTNEIHLAGPWELRQFQLNATTLGLREVPVTREPDDQFNGSNTLTTFINQNEAKILAGTHQVPLAFAGASFRAGASPNNIDFWASAGVRSARARHLFSVNTCNGCHGGETATGFLHVFPRDPGQPAQLSGFLTGSDVADPVTGTVRRFDDLTRRATDLKNLICAPGATAAQPVNERVH